MEPRVAHTTSFWNSFWKQRFAYTVTAAVVAFVTYLLLYMIGFVPNEFRYQKTSPIESKITTQSTTSIDDLSTAAPKNETAEQIVIDKIGVNSVIKNPVSTDTQTLNNYLEEGAVRWPTSGQPGNGNLFLFGHSTSYETVWNQAYKTFNGIGELQKGDEITVKTDSGVYTYSVITTEFKRDSAAYIPFDSGENMLTLATCNNFGAKEDRIVVRAQFTGYTPYAE